MDGLASFRALAAELLFGSERSEEVSRRVDTVQTLGASGALRVGFEFLRRDAPLCAAAPLLLPTPTYSNHAPIIASAGVFNVVHEIPYFSARHRCFSAAEFFDALDSASPHSVVLLQTSAHNPTGCDPTPEEWQEMAQIMKRRHVSSIPRFASARAS